MDQLTEFASNHMTLIGILIATAVALVITESRKGGAKVSPQQAVIMINQQNAVVVDLRDKVVFAKGHIVDAINIPLSVLNKRAVELESNKNNPIILVCAMGQQTGAAAHILKNAGFSQVTRMAGGMTEWQSSNFPLVK